MIFTTETQRTQRERRIQEERGFLVPIFSHTLSFFSVISVSLW
jgi:hypothetical protein